MQLTCRGTVLGLVAVDPAAQDAGLGGRLADAATDELAPYGATRAPCLHVLADNTAAVRLYAAHGWTPYGPSFDHALLDRPRRPTCELSRNVDTYASPTLRSRRRTLSTLRDDLDVHSYNGPSSVGNKLEAHKALILLGRTLDDG